MQQFATKIILQKRLYYTVMYLVCCSDSGLYSAKDDTVVSTVLNKEVSRSLNLVKRTSGPQIMLTRPTEIGL